MCLKSVAPVRTKLSRLVRSDVLRMYKLRQASVSLYSMQNAFVYVYTVHVRLTLIFSDLFDLFGFGLNASFICSESLAVRHFYPPLLTRVSLRADLFWGVRVTAASNPERRS